MASPVRSPYEREKPVISSLPSPEALSSLRPAAVTIRGKHERAPQVPSLPPEAEPEPAPGAPPPRRGRKLVLVACVALCAAVGSAVAWRTLPYEIHAPKASVVSGRAGLKTTPTGAHEHWAATSATITIDPTLGAGTPAAKDAVVRAFGAWTESDADLPQIAFDTTSTPGEAAHDGVNRLLLGPITVQGHEEDLAITITYADESTGTIVEADTIFNDAYSWASIDAASQAGDGHGTNDDSKDTCGRRYDLQNVATHEAGHFFGLGEDVEDTTTTMYLRSLPCQTSKRTLSAADVSVVSGLYPKQQAQASSNHGCHHASVASGRGETSGVALAMIATVAAAAARRRRRRAD